jgi:ribosomal-protein-alanine N-acetyltransferase
VFAYARNPNVARTTSWVAHRSTADSQAFVDFAKAQTAAPSWVWALRLRDDGVAIGSISLRIDAGDPGRAHLDYALDERHWGRGLVTEAARAVVGWAFTNLGSLERVASGGLTENLASLRVMEKCGMRRVRVFRMRFRKFGEAREVAAYEVTRADFLRKD